MKIENCPFCDGKAKYYRDESYGYHDEAYIACKNVNCLVNPQTVRYSNVRWNKTNGNVSNIKQAKAKALEAWNTRKPYGGEDDTETP